MPKLKTMIENSKTPLSKRFRAILGILKYIGKPEGMSRTTLIKELKQYGISRNQDTIERDILFLTDLNAIEYKEKSPGDKFKRVSITEIGRIIFSGKIEFEKFELPMTNKVFRQWLKKILEYFEGMKQLDYIDNTHFQVVDKAILTIDENLSPSGMDELIVASLKQLKDKFEQVSNLQKLPEEKNYNRYYAMVNSLFNYYTLKLQSIKESIHKK
jgi:hypothetical protein